MIRTDNTETLKNALKRIKELEEENEKMKAILNSVAESNTYAYLLDAQKKAKYFLEE